jgi:hypothetical protein
MGLALSCQPGCSKAQTLRGVGSCTRGSSPRYSPRHGRCVRRDLLQDDRLGSESLLWNFTVLREAAAQVSDDLKERFAEIPWQQRRSGVLRLRRVRLGSTGRG